MRMQKKKALVEDINLPVPEKKHRTMISQPISLRDLLEAGLSTQVSDKGAPQNIEQATDLIPTINLQKTPEEQIILDARYVGDLTPEHFGTPRKARRHL
ncbi:hypothetical protein NQ314_001511, partial [Rhamnusium bicolor]